MEIINPGTRRNLWAQSAMLRDGFR